MQNKEKIRDIITLVTGGIVLIALIISVIMSAYSKNMTKLLDGVADSSLVGYEQGVLTAKKVSLLFEIYNEETYQEAKEKLPCTEEYKNKIFPQENYSKIAKSYTKPTVEVLQVQYSMENESIYKYLVDLEVTDNDTEGVSYASCIVSVSMDNKIVDIEIL